MKLELHSQVRKVTKCKPDIKDLMSLMQQQISYLISNLVVVDIGAVLLVMRLVYQSLMAKVGGSLPVRDASVTQLQKGVLGFLYNGGRKGSQSHHVTFQRAKGSRKVLALTPYPLRVSMVTGLPPLTLFAYINLIISEAMPLTHALFINFSVTPRRSAETLVCLFVYLFV